MKSLLKAPTLFVNNKELLTELSLRELKSRYKQSILGYAWVVLNPLSQMIVMAFVFSTILRVSTPNTPYALFLYVGLLPWTFFTNSLLSSAQILVSNSSLITKIYFPRELLVIATILAKCVDFFAASSLLIVFFLWYGQPWHWTALLFFPLLALQLLMTYGLGLLAAALNLLYRDVQYLLSLVLLVWMYLTPIVYPLEIVPEKYLPLFNLNPFAVLVSAYRQVLLQGQVPTFNTWLILLIHATVLFLVGWAVFKRLEALFADSI